MGTAVKMGPAYFPTILGGLLVLIGTIFTHSLLRCNRHADWRFRIQRALFIVGSTLLFGASVRGAGLIVALPLLVIISAYASMRFRWRTDASDGAWPDDLLRFGVRQRLGHTIGDSRPVVRRLSRSIFNEECRGTARSSCAGVSHRCDLGQLVLLLHRGFFGTAIGVLTGTWSHRYHRHAVAGHFVLPPESALIMFAGIYYGSQYGGSTTSILVNLPGEAASVVTTLDGYQMAKQGRAAAARPLPPSVRFLPVPWRHY